MRFKKIVLALFACMALGAAAANATQAAEQWTVGTPGTTLTKEGLSCKKHGTSSLTLHGSILNVPFHIDAPAIECEEAFIETTAGDTGAHSVGFLKFTGITVTEPPHCTLGTVTTTKLTDKIIKDPKGGGTLFDKFTPFEGETFVELTLEGAECPLAGVSTPLKGAVCGESVHTNAAGTAYEPNAGGELRTVQTLLFGEAQQITAGCELRQGKKVAQFSGVVDNELNGKVTEGNKGKAFGADV